MNRNFLHIYNKELRSFFSSSIAYIFIFCFLAVSLFSFFWVEGFFARNIADIKPLFEWLPILLIFLVSALTMKMWSEEKRTGTIEVLFSSPQKRLTYVLGKFSASLTLVIICLLMTVGIPITVHYMGALDTGPVIGAYLACIFLSAFYISVGLYISAKTDNQIVSLIMSIFILSIFYLIGSNFFTAFFGNNIADIFRLIGSGSRFEAITRGVLDVRDIYYYLSLCIIFLSLNLYTLKNLAWDKNKSHIKTNKMFFLIIANVFVLNFCLNFVNSLRVDLTKDHRYSISPATKNIVQNLEEPLLIRGYFSKRTHPLLSPLIPQLKDLIKEYKVAGNGKIDIEFIDPKDSPDAEKLASAKYGIRPIPFQVGDKYEASLVNSYFDILIEYGDKYEVLNFKDLIEIKVLDETHIDVLLKNPEYDITRSIKKVLYEFKDISSLLSELNGTINFKAYVSHDALLPKALAVLRGDLNDILNDLKKQTDGKFDFEFITPDKKIAKEIYEKYGFQPMVGSLLSNQAFYFYMVLNNGKEEYAVTLPTDFQKESLRKSIENTLKRFSKGFIKTIGISSPRPEMNMQALNRTGKSFQLLIQKLQETYKTKILDLSSGIIPEDIDILVVNSPKDFDKKSVYAIDQFLMRGGSIIFNAGSHFITRSYDSVKAAKDPTGLEDWFKNNGVAFGKDLILDENNENYPIPTKRDLGGLVVQELKMIQYPMFVDVRSNSMNLDAGIPSGITQVTLNWPNEILIDKEKNKERTVTPLLNSSKNSWALDTESIEPNFLLFPKWGFRQTDKTGPFTLAYVIEGNFNSFFTEKDNPFSKESKEKEAKELEESEGKTDKENKDDKAPLDGSVVSFVSHSPSSSKIIIFASNEFVEDSTLRVSASTGGSRFMNSLQLVENAIDWSLEDKTLLSIRGKTNFSETLRTMSKEQKEFYEILNYSIAFILLIFSYVIYKIRKTFKLNHYKKLFS